MPPLPRGNSGRSSTARDSETRGAGPRDRVTGPPQRQGPASNPHPVAGLEGLAVQGGRGRVSRRGVAIRSPGPGQHARVSHAPAPWRSRLKGAGGRGQATHPEATGCGAGRCVHHKIKWLSLALPMGPRLGRLHKGPTGGSCHPGPPGRGGMRLPPRPQRSVQDPEPPKTAGRRSGLERAHARLSYPNTRKGRQAETMPMTKGCIRNGVGCECE